MRESTQHKITLSSTELERLLSAISDNQKWLPDLNDTVTISLDFDTDTKSLRISKTQYQCLQHSKWSECASHNFTLTEEKYISHTNSDDPKHTIVTVADSMGRSLL